MLLVGAKGLLPRKKYNNSSAELHGMELGPRPRQGAPISGTGFASMQDLIE